MLSPPKVIRIESGPAPDLCVDCEIRVPIFVPSDPAGLSIEGNFLNVKRPTLPVAVPTEARNREACHSRRLRRVFTGHRYPDRGCSEGLITALKQKLHGLGCRRGGRQENSNHNRPNESDEYLPHGLDAHDLTPLFQALSVRACRPRSTAR